MSSHALEELLQSLQYLGFGSTLLPSTILYHHAFLCLFTVCVCVCVRERERERQRERELKIKLAFILVYFLNKYQRLFSVFWNLSLFFFCLTHLSLVHVHTHTHTHTHTCAHAHARTSTHACKCSSTQHTHSHKYTKKQNIFMNNLKKLVNTELL